MYSMWKSKRNNMHGINIVDLYLLSLMKAVIKGFIFFLYEIVNILYFNNYELFSFK